MIGPKKTWGRQKPPLGSQLDRSHPLAQGLDIRYLFNEGAGVSVFNLVDGSAGTLLSAYTDGVKWKNFQAIDNPSDTYPNFALDTNTTKPYKKYTVIFRGGGRQVGDGGAYGGGGTSIVWQHNDSPSYNENIRLYSNSSTSYLASIGNGGSNNGVSTGTLPTRSIDTIAVTFDGATLKIYAEGVLMNSVAQTGNINSPHPLSIFYEKDLNPTGYAQGASFLDDISIYNCALSGNAIASWFEDRYQMIAPPPGLIFTSLPSGAITLYSLLDTSSETDALLDVLAALTNADSSTTSDARSATGFPAEGDSGLAYDALTGVFKPAYLESGAGTDALTGSGTGAQADAVSTGLDALAAIGSGAKADSGAGTDGLNFSLISGLSDSSSVGDILALLPGAMLLSDLGDVADAPLMPGIYLLSDDAVVSDSLSVLGIVVGAADASTTGSALSAIIGSLGVSDALHGSDGLAMTMGAVGELDATGATFSGLIVRVHGVGVGIAAFTFGIGFIDGSAFGGNIN